MPRKYIFILIFSLFLTAAAAAQDKSKCRSLDIREFGLVSAGEIGVPWTEAQLIEKYGLPCYVIELGEVYIEKSKEHIKELDTDFLPGETLKSRTKAYKREFIYSGDSANKTSVFTIIDGVVVKKQRIQ